MSDTVELETAAIETKAARERLLATTKELRARLDTATLIDEARDGIRYRALELVENAGEAAQRRPNVAAGLGAAIALFVLRRPLKRLARRLFRGKETRDPRRR